MAFRLEFLVIAILFGPGLAISYGLEHPDQFRPVASLVTLFVLETASVALVYSLLRKLPTELRFSNKILEKLALEFNKSKEGIVKSLEAVSKKFIDKLGDLGFHIALALISFAYGVYIAAIAAYFVKVRLKRAIVPIAAGGFASIVFWWYMANGLVPFVTPEMVFIVITGTSVIFMAYGFLRENATVRKIALSLEERREIRREKREAAAKGRAMKKTAGEK